MPSPLLALFKYVFLAVLYLFFLRVLRVVWIELREPKVVAASKLPSPEQPHKMTRRQRKKQLGGAERLVVTEPPERKGETFQLGDELTVGRAPGCGVSLPTDTFVSQLHARLFRREGTLFVEDLGSTNGTFLNSQRLSTEAPIRKGDRLQVGKTVLELTK